MTPRRRPIARLLAILVAAFVLGATPPPAAAASPADRTVSGAHILNSDGTVAEAVEAASSRALVAIAWIERRADSGDRTLILTWGGFAPTEHLVVLGDGERRPTYFDLFADDTGLIHLLWTAEGARDGAVYYTVVSLEGGLTTVLVGETSGNELATCPGLALDRTTGLAHAVWLAGTGTYQRVHFAEADAAGSFTTTELTAGRPPSFRAYPQVFESGGRIEATWYETDRNGDLVLSGLLRGASSSTWNAGTLGYSRFPADRLPLLLQRDGGALAALYCDADPLGGDAAFLLDLAPGAEPRRLSDLAATAGLPVPARFGDGLLLGWIQEDVAGQGFRIVTETPATMVEGGTPGSIDLFVRVPPEEPQHLSYPALAFRGETLHFVWIDDPHAGGDGMLRLLAIPAVSEGGAAPEVDAVDGMDEVDEMDVANEGAIVAAVDAESAPAPRHTPAPAPPPGAAQTVQHEAAARTDRAVPLAD